MLLYVSCEAGIWNWLARHLIAQGISESRALNVLSLGFGLGLVVGRVAISPILMKAPAVTVTLASSAAMAATSYLVLSTRSVKAAWIRAFLVGLAMAPVFATTLAIVSDAFPQMIGTAIGVTVTFGWVGMAVSSRIIGTVAGGDPRRLKKALLLIPAFSLLMVAVNLALLTALRK